ncbi:MAG: FG-GAP repeat domain-containing protein [Promethearchaeota archaeon]
MKTQRLVIISLICIILFSLSINSIPAKGTPRLMKRGVITASDAAKTPLDIGSYSVPIVMDWNQDGANDFVVGEGAGAIYLFINDGTNANTSFNAEGEFLTYSNGTGIIIEGFASPTIADWNNDGLIDLIIGSQQGKVSLFLNEGNPSQPLFSTRTYLKVGMNEILDVGTWAAPHVVDWNGDGKLDLIVGTYQGQVLFFENNGTVSDYSLTNPITLKEGDSILDVGFHLHPFCVDWDEDGLIDLVAGDSRGDLRWYKRRINNDTVLMSSQFIKDVSDEAVGVSERSSPFLFDWNGDSLLDLFSGDALGQISMFENLPVGSSVSISSSTTIIPPLLTPGYLFISSVLSAASLILWRKRIKLTATDE